MSSNAESFGQNATLKPRALGPGAEVRLTLPQGLFLLALISLLMLTGTTFHFDFIAYGQLFVAVSSVFFLAMLVFSVTIAIRGAREDSIIHVSDEEALDKAMNHPDELPPLKVLVPVYDEAPVAPQLCKALDNLHYPREKLEVIVLTEAGDLKTQAAFLKHAPPWMKIWVRPENCGPMTKPGVLNWAVNKLREEGDLADALITIYDGEDVPERLQAVKAYIAIEKAQAIDDRVACVQARLAFSHNANKNLITRLLSLDYIQHFGLILPGLSSLGLMSPLGGTSNYFLGKVLVQYLWDAHNVTEDLNLAVFLLRDGWLTRVFDSVTAEEAVEDVVSFIKQRSRWIKGGMQTYFRHMRNPVQLFKDLGLKRFISFQLVVGAPLVLYMVNPLFWSLTAIYATTHAPWIQQLYPSLIFYIASGCFVFGNAAYLYFLQIAAFKTKNYSTVMFAFLAPLYWVLLSVAGYKALIEFTKSKKGASKWSKTAHKGVAK